MTTDHQNYRSWVGSLCKNNMVLVQRARDHWTGTTLERDTDISWAIVAKTTATGVKVGYSWYHRTGPHAGRSRRRFSGQWAQLRDPREFGMLAPASAVTPSE